MNESDIESTEQFARDILPDLIDEDEYSEYHGIFKKNVKKFKILIGFKKLLICISDFYKEKLVKKTLPNLQHQKVKKGL